MVPGDTYATRRRLPHLSKPSRSYFVTFCTFRRRILEPAERTIVLDCCVHDHRRDYWLECVVVMPDHVHLILAPYEHTSISRVMQCLKSVSAHKVNKENGQRGRLWQEESFDRLIRSEENLRRKAEYISCNPVRAGLVAGVDDYQWIWREWIEGRTGEGACSPTGITS